MNKLIFLLVILLLTSCVTPYKTWRQGNCVKHKILNDDTYIVTKMTDYRVWIKMLNSSWMRKVVSSTDRSYRVVPCPIGAK